VIVTRILAALQGKTACAVGQSNVVELPAALLLMNRGTTV
jgi:5,10-methylene-tetrahydrofolate dehydrogenase/methenyl tetrahydrofolate cyclohydrolase